MTGTPVRESGVFGKKMLNNLPHLLYICARI